MNEYDYEYYGRIHDMDFSFWEIEQRPMYGFGKYMKMRHTRPTVNPNSGNLAAFFTGEFGRDVYYRGWRRWGTGWVHVLSKRIEDYPFDIDGEYREPEYDDEEW